MRYLQVIYFIVLFVLFSNNLSFACAYWWLGVNQGSGNAGSCGTPGDSCGRYNGTGYISSENSSMCILTQRVIDDVIYYDEDGSGVLDTCEVWSESYDSDPNGDCDGDGTINSSDVDWDGNEYPDLDEDGVIDCCQIGFDCYDSDPSGDCDGDGTINSDDTDWEVDTDNDGLKNEIDDDDDGDGIDDSEDDDQDGDGVLNDQDDDIDGDGKDNSVDTDDDGDGIPDDNDSSPEGYNPVSSGGSSDPDDWDYEDVEDDKTQDICADDPACDCIPTTYTYQGQGDSGYDECCQIWSDGTNYLYCACISGDCTEDDDISINSSSLEQLANLIASTQGRNLTNSQLSEQMEYLSSMLENSSAEQTDRILSYMQTLADETTANEDDRTNALLSKIEDVIDSNIDIRDAINSLTDGNDSPTVPDKAESSVDFETGLDTFISDAESSTTTEFLTGSSITTSGATSILSFTNPITSEVQSVDYAQWEDEFSMVGTLIYGSCCLLGGLIVFKR